jgi:hypothetical protein
MTKTEKEKISLIPMGKLLIEKEPYHGAKTKTKTTATKYKIQMKNASMKTILKANKND